MGPAGLSTPSRRGRHCGPSSAQTSLGHLRFWMLGVPAPGEPAEVADAAAPRRVIEQGGWRIGYDTFRPVSGSALPERFTATRGRVRLKVVIDDWAVVPKRLPGHEFARGEPGRAEPWPAPGKVNLFLHVVGRRADGYHLLQTAFQFIDLCDEIRFWTRPAAWWSGSGTCQGCRRRQI